MTEAELLQTLARGEDSRHQFKRDLANPDGVAVELAAMANSGGGAIFIGVAMTATSLAWMARLCGA